MIILISIAIVALFVVGPDKAIAAHRRLTALGALVVGCAVAIIAAFDPLMNKAIATGVHLAIGGAGIEITAVAIVAGLTKALLVNPITAHPRDAIR